MDIQAQIDEINKKREAVKKANTVECNAPVKVRTYTYRKNVPLRALYS